MNRGGTVKDKDIHIRDIVRVRQWDDMANEFRCIFDFFHRNYKKTNSFYKPYEKILWERIYSIRGVYVKRYSYWL